MCIAHYWNGNWDLSNMVESFFLLQLECRLDIASILMSVAPWGVQQQLKMQSRRQWQVNIATGGLWTQDYRVDTSNKRLLIMSWTSAKGYGGSQFIVCLMVAWKLVGRRWTRCWILGAKCGPGTRSLDPRWCPLMDWDAQPCTLPLERKQTGENLQGPQKYFS